MPKYNTGFMNTKDDNEYVLNHLVVYQTPNLVCHDFHNPCGEIPHPFSPKWLENEKDQVVLGNMENWRS